LRRGKSLDRKRVPSSTSGRDVAAGHSERVRPRGDRVDAFYQTPPANFYRSLRAMRQAEAVAQVFLATHPVREVPQSSLRCLTQNDYHDFAAFFLFHRLSPAGHHARDRLDKHEFIGEQIAGDCESNLKHPRSGG
jgi:hypothetical protein